jgi:hypothetical protein
LQKRHIILAATTAVFLSMPITFAQAQEGREGEIIGLHQLCDSGDRRACIRFGMLLQENREHHEDWHHNHPEWFWWQR